MTGTVLAVDGGNSKTDVALLDDRGRLLAALRGPTVSHQAIGPADAARRLTDLGVAVAERAGRRSARSSALGGGSDGIPIADVAVLCLAGLDLPEDSRLLRRVHGASGLGRELLLRNDTLAALRAGSEAGWGVAVICGAGINGVGVAPDGRVARFAGLGSISGDRGGGTGLGLDALGAAVRGRDGRGPRTALERLVPAHFGLGRPMDVTAALYRGALGDGRLGELAPVAVDAARAGDAVALALVDDLATEIAAFAIAAIRRLSLTRRPVPVVLAGGVARGAADLLVPRVDGRVRVVAPAAQVGVLHAPPVLGAALMGLDRLVPGDTAAAGRARAGLTLDAF